MTTSAQPIEFSPFRERLRYRLRILRVLAAAEFKLKYSGSVLGYVWSLIKPLSIFSVLLLVFGHILKLGSFPNYGLYLLIGLALWFFFVDACTGTMVSIVNRGALLRRLAFPRITVPMSTGLTAGITFCVNTIVVGVFLAWQHFTPTITWLAILPLLLELYIFTLGMSLILATLYVRFRDVGQIWEVGSQMLFYASPIVYLPGLLPRWFQPLMFLNPFTQVMQDVRALILPAGKHETVTHYLLGSSGRMIPITIALLVLMLGLWLFRNDSPYFAERV